MDRAERWNQMPWEPFDQVFRVKSSRVFWLACDLMLQRARRRHQEWQRTQAAPGADSD